MTDLVNYCVKYISDNINSVIALGEGVNSYKSNIAKKIAKIITIENLDRIHDQKDVIFSWIYKKKLEIFFESSENLLYICESCNMILTNS